MGGDKHENAGHKTIISGLVTVGWECAGGHAIEYAKIVKQTKTITYLEIAKQMTSNGTRLYGILDGFLPWGAIQAAFKGAVFGSAHATIRNKLYKADLFPNFAVEVISGGLAGGVQGFVLSPLLLLKTRVMTDASFKNSSGSSFWQSAKASTAVISKVVQHEGLSGVMKGAGWFSGKRVLDWTTRFFFVEVVEDAMKKWNGSNKLTFGESLSASLLGGTMSAFVTIPIDIIVANVQRADKAGQKVSGMSMLNTGTGSEGFIAKMQMSTRGFVARALHVAITTAMMKPVVSYFTKQYENYSKNI